MSMADANPGDDASSLDQEKSRWLVKVAGLELSSGEGMRDADDRSVLPVPDLYLTHHLHHAWYVGATIVGSDWFRAALGPRWQAWLAAGGLSPDQADPEVVARAALDELARLTTELAATDPAAIGVVPAVPPLKPLPPTNAVRLSRALICRAGLRRQLPIWRIGVRMQGLPCGDCPDLFAPEQARYAWKVGNALLARAGEAGHRWFASVATGDRLKAIRHPAAAIALWLDATSPGGLAELRPRSQCPLSIGVLAAVLTLGGMVGAGWLLITGDSFVAALEIAAEERQGVRAALIAASALTALTGLGIYRANRFLRLLYTAVAIALPIVAARTGFGGYYAWHLSLAALVIVALLYNPPVNRWYEQAHERV